MLPGEEAECSATVNHLPRYGRDQRSVAAIRGGERAMGWVSGLPTPRHISAKSTLRAIGDDATPRYLYLLGTHNRISGCSQQKQQPRRLAHRFEMRYRNARETGTGAVGGPRRPRWFLQRQRHYRAWWRMRHRSGTSTFAFTSSSISKEGVQSAWPRGGGIGWVRQGLEPPP